MEIGHTTDEILLYYIDKYECEENLSDTQFANISEVDRTTIFSMRKSVRGMNASRKMIATYRTKKLILKVAIYTDMPFADVKRALELSGVTFNEIDPIDGAIVEWLCKDEPKRDIRELNKLILEHGEVAGLTERQVEGHLYHIPVVKKS